MAIAGGNNLGPNAMDNLMVAMAANAQTIQTLVGKGDESKVRTRQRYRRPLINYHYDHGSPSDCFKNEGATLTDALDGAYQVGYSLLCRWWVGNFAWQYSMQLASINIGANG